MQLRHHPAPGFGELMPGFHVVPQNPIRDAGTVLVPSVQAAAGNQIVRVPHMGELLPGTFRVPSNPILKNLTGGMSGLGCGPACGLGQVQQAAASGNLMGSLGGTIGSVGTWLQQSMLFGIPNWALVAAGIGAVMFMAPGGSEYRGKRAALRSQYRGYRRAARYTGEQLG